MRCSYCYAGEKSKKSMDDELIEKSIVFVVEQVQKRKVNKLVMAFLGGEPLMEKKSLFYIHDQIRKRLNKDVKIVAQISTNGLLLTDALMGELTSRGILVSLSIDGSPTTMLAQRPTIGASDYSKIMERAIDNVIKHNPFTNAFCVITPQSAKDLYENITWIYDRGLRFINTTLDYSAAWTYEDFRILESEYEKLASWYIQRSNNVEHFYLSSFDERIQTRTKKPVDCSMKCSIGNNQISISPDGILYPCTQFVKPSSEANPNFQLGSINKGLDEKSVSQLKNELVKEKPECKGCALLDRCSTWCSCINYSSTNGISKASPVACLHEKTLLPIVDRMSNKLWKEKNQLFIQKHYNPMYSMVAQALSSTLS